MAQRDLGNGAPPARDGSAPRTEFTDLFGEAPAVMAAARRLKAAREQAGYETASAAALAFGWPPSKYLAHESGDRPLMVKAATAYAAAFAVNSRWLQSGEGPSDDRAPRKVDTPNGRGPVPATGHGAGTNVTEPSEAMLRAAREAVFRLAAQRGLVPQSVPWDQALALAETWREIADTAVRAALGASRK